MLWLLSLAYRSPKWAIGILVLIALFGIAALFTFHTLAAILLSLFTLVVSLFCLYFFRWIIPKKHDAKEHVFTELEYKEDIPILRLSYGTHYQTGFDAGYLLAHSLQKFLVPWHWVVRLVYPAVDIAAIKKTIPSEYLEEMNGFADGTNQKLKKKLLSQDLLIRFHLLGDILHFHPNIKFPLGCSMVCLRSLFFRNMDWPSLGVVGTYTLIAERKLKDVTTYEIGLPGLLGTITGMNSHGLCIAMSVCKGKTNEIRGMPSLLFNRLCLERCKRAADIKELLREFSPLGAYNLVAGDPENALSFHFYQNEDGSHYIQELKTEPLIVTNSCYSSTLGAHNHYFYSSEREEKIREYLEKNKLAGEELLSLPLVNNIETCHSVILDPQNRHMRVAFNNAFAAQGPFTDLSCK